jgi:hypothetical protein
MYNASYNNAGNNSVAAHAYRAPFQRTDVQVQAEPYMITEVITPELAEIYLAKTFGNRPIKSRKVQEYAAAMKAGKWYMTGETIKFDVIGSLVDGHHRLHAIVKSGAAAKIAVIRDLPFEAVNSLDQGVKRTTGDVLAMRGIDNYNLVGAVARVLAYYTQGGKYTGTAMQMDAIMEFVDLQSIYIKKSQISEFCPRASEVYAAKFLLDRYQDHAAVDHFFNVLATGWTTSDEDKTIIVYRHALELHKRKKNLRMPNMTYLYQTLRIFGYWLSKKPVSIIQFGSRDKTPTVINARTLQHVENVPNTFPLFHD